MEIPSGTERDDTRSAGRIARPVLVERINAGLDRGAVAVVAPAGFGKTLALEEALSERPDVAAWVTCEEGEGDGAVLFARIVSTLRRVVPGLTDVLDERLRAGGVWSDMSGEVDRLVSELSALLVDPLVLVVDDADHVAASTSAVAVLDRLVRADVRRLRVAVCSRRGVVSRAARLRATGRLTVFGAADLSFDASDVVDIVIARSGRRPTESQVARIMSLTEGWPLGVALAWRALLDDALDDTLATHAELLEYLAEEILDRLSDDARAAVLRSSLTEEITPATAEALELGEWMFDPERRAELPLRAVEQRHDRLRWHPLVRQFLRDRARLELPAGERRRLEARLAGALQAEGDDQAALGHWVAAERWPQALDMLLRDDMALSNRSPPLVETWLGQMPAEAHDHPAWALLQGSRLLHVGDFHEAMTLLQVALAGFRARGDVAGEWYARRSMIPLLVVGDPEALLALAEGFDQPSAIRIGTAPLAVGTAAAWVLESSGRRDAARDLLERTRRHPGARAIAPAVESHIAHFEFVAGDVAAAIERLEACRSRKDGETWPTALALTRWAGMLSEIGLDAQALAAWQEAEAYADRHGIARFVGQAQRNRALIHLRAGNVAEADIAIARADALGAGEPRLSAAIAAMKAAGRGPAADADATALRVLELRPRADVATAASFLWWLAPILIESASQSARSKVDEVTKEWDACFPGEYGRHIRARLLLVDACLRRRRGETSASARLGQAWREAGPNVAHVLRPLWPHASGLVADATTAGGPPLEELLRVLGEVRQDGRAVLDVMLESSDAEFRARAAAYLVRTGHPSAGALIGRDEAGIRSALTDLRANPPSLGFRVLGHFGLRRGPWEIPEAAWRRPVAARLVRFLLAQRQQAVPEDEIFGALWPGKTPDTARRSLHVALSQARSVVDVPGVATSAIRQSERTHRLVLNPRDTVDADEFSQLATTALADDGSSRLALLERAAASWAGEPLPEDSYADWAIPWRTRLIELHEQLLRALSLEREANGDPLGALDATHELLGHDPANEEAHRRLIRLNARAGRTGHALRQYLACRRALIDALGIEPSAATRELHARVLAGEPI